MDTLLGKIGASQGFQVLLHTDYYLGGRDCLPSCYKSCQLLLQAHFSSVFCCHTTPFLHKARPCGRSLPSTGGTKACQSARPACSSNSETATPRVEFSHW